MMANKSPVRELRVAITVPNYEDAIRFYRDVLGLPVVESWDEPTGQGSVLDAGRATLEIISSAQADHIDQVEVGKRVAGQVRLALEVEDSAATADKLNKAGAEHLGGPVVTPWQHRNVRLKTPDGMQITLYTVLASNQGD
jgi:catechol 2,3-dioxygenase-like lactoylglutathione lyase family enzyme